MNARFYLPIVTLCIACALAGCGSVTNGTAFQAPAGWSGTPALFGRAQLWYKSGEGKNKEPQMVMLVKGDAKNMKADFSDVPAQYGKNTDVIARGDIRVCGTQPAKQIIAEGTDKDGKRSHIEMVSTVIGADRYVAMYIRPAAMAADNSAETAIHSICPVKQ